MDLIGTIVMTVGAQWGELLALYDRSLERQQASDLFEATRGFRSVAESQADLHASGGLCDDRVA